MPLASVRRLHSRRSLAWLVALVLWLPVAQWAAASHALLHLPLSAASAEDPERPAHGPGACNTCVVAAAILGAAPAAEFSPPPPAEVAHAQPLAGRNAALPLSPRAAYRSRAPPLLHA